MALPRHMFCGGPDYSPAVVLTLACVDSSSLNTHTKFQRLCQRLPRHDFTREPFPASNKMPLSPEKGGEKEGGKRWKERRGGGSMFSTTVWYCGRVILAGRPRSRLWKWFVSEVDCRQEADQSVVGDAVEDTAGWLVLLAYHMTTITTNVFFI